MNKKSRRFRNKTEAAAFIVITDSFILQKKGGALYVKSSEMISDRLNLLPLKALSAYQKLMSNIIMTKGIFIGK
ncbi:hypothetical protein [Huintestinicola butyrica]|jgi:DNA polymerase III delta prime subunit|uniref:hypothetical protein n=1 Tax=Huintestinicola butyrica TaxID=2981728 RepID=UPI0021CEA017|nr:hypothetical protein [Huintestinicola butyrica]MCU6728700.1 hypothetical protein [Huintestinicola butyrica]